jgi:tripartite ATP-independent transporter DctP family solute receptor
MKKISALLLAVVFVLAAGAQAFAAQYEINIAIHTYGNEANETLTAEYFKKIVEERSKGEIVVKNFPNGTLGTELENVAQIKTGEVECALLSANAYQQIIPEYEVTGLPFSFPSAAAVDEYWAGEFAPVIAEALATRNNTVMYGLLHRGARMLTASREVKTPADVSGLKLRVPEIKSWITVWQALGALPTPINLNEVYAALQTRVVDGQENPIDTIYGAKIHEVNKFVMETGHLYSCFYWTYNKDFIEGLPADMRKLVEDATLEALKWGNDNVAKNEVKIIEQMKAEGATLIPVDKKAWMDAAKPGVIEALKTFNPDAAKVVMQYLN